jgi:hypothetical protein
MQQLRGVAMHHRVCGQPKQQATQPFSLSFIYLYIFSIARYGLSPIDPAQ